MSKFTEWYQANKSAVWSVGGVVVVVILIILGNLLFHKKTGDVVPETQTPADTALESSGNPAMSYTAPIGTPASVAPKLGYDAALAKFGRNRIQFDEKCVAVPSNTTFKTGTEIMLDNRSAQAKVFALNGTTYSIGAYDYAVATLTGAANIMIDCGTMQNVAVVTVQN